MRGTAEWVASDSVWAEVCSLLLIRIFSEFFYPGYGGYGGLGGGGALGQGLYNRYGLYNRNRFGSGYDMNGMNGNYGGMGDRSSSGSEDQ